MQRTMKTALAIMLSILMVLQVFPMVPVAAEPADPTFAQNIWDKFVTPPAESKSRPLWFWNEEIINISDDQLEEIVEKSFTESGYYGFGILPFWLQGYMSPEYLHKYEVVLAKAEELGMKMCLYDENGFPSYNAGGLLEDKYPELTAKRLDKIEKTVTGPSTGKLDLPGEGYYMGAVMMNTATNEIIDISDKAVIVDPETLAGNFGVGVYASSYYTLSAGYTPDKAFDGNPNTRWNAAAMSGGNQWIEVNYETAQTFDKVTVRESMSRITSHKLQYWTGTDWATIESGTTIGDNVTKTFSFSPVTSRRVRFYINSVSTDSASIWEMEVFNGGAKLAVPANKPAPEIESSRVDYTVPAGNWKVMGFMCIKSPRVGMDYLDEESVGKFIEVTHQKYYEAFPQYFGRDKVIDSAFYDEPTFWPWAGTTPYGVEGGRMWTPNFNEKFKEIKGALINPIVLYPALWYDIGENTDYARNMLHEVRTELFATSYIKQMNDWCQAHDMDLTGHMLLEEIGNPVGLHGDLMKVFKYQSMPGVDVIGSYGYTQEAYKIISSSAYNWDHGKVTSESYGAINNMPIHDLYRIAMDEFAKGINNIVPHAVWYNDTPDKVYYKPELSYRNATYGPALPAYNEYIGRLQQLLQNGRHVADIGMLYPIDELEGNFRFDVPGNDFHVPANTNYMNIGEQLSLVLRRDFTYIHPEVLDEKVTIEGNELKLNNAVNYENYKVMILPNMKTISMSNLTKLKNFYAAGGKIIAIGGRLPTVSTELGQNAQVIAVIKEIFGVDPVTYQPLEGAANGYYKKTNANGGMAIATDMNRLGTALDEAVAVYDVEFGGIAGVSGGNFSYIHKVKEGSDIYFLANSSTTKVSGTVDIRGKIEPQAWDPHTGKRYFPSYEYLTIDGVDVTRVTLEVAGYKSLFIMDNPREEGTYMLKIDNPQGVDAQVIIGGTAYDLPYAEILEGGRMSAEIVSKDQNYIFSHVTGAVNGSNNPVAVDLSKDIVFDVNFEYTGNQSVLLDGTAGATANRFETASAWLPKNINDGIRYSTGASSGLSSRAFTAATLDGAGDPVGGFDFWVNMASGKTINTVELYPRTDIVRADGQSINFPVNYTVQVQLISGEYKTVAAVTEQANPMGKPVKFTFDAVEAKAVKINVTKVGLPDLAENRFRCQIAELAAYHNAGQGQDVTLTIKNQGSGKIRINGAVRELPYAGTYTKGERLLIEPADSENSVFNGFSGDGVLTGQMLAVTLNSDFAATANFNNYGVVRNIAREGVASTNNNLSAISVDGGWDISLINDGVTKGTGYSTNTFSSQDASDNPPYVEIDLGSDRNINSAVFYPRSDAAVNGSQYFPKDFKIEVRTQSGQVITVADKTNYPDANGQPQIFDFDAVDARYVRLTATKLGTSAEPSVYRMQFAEMEIYSTVNDLPNIADTITVEPKDTNAPLLIREQGGMLALDASVLPETANNTGYTWYVHETNDQAFGAFSGKAEIIIDKDGQAQLVGLAKGFVYAVARANDKSGIVGMLRVDIMPDGKSPEIEAGMVDENGNPIDAAVLTNEEFTIKVVTAGEVEYVKFTNENDMSIGKKATVVTVNEDGSKTWLITMALATAGEDRELNIWTAGADKEYTVTGVSVKVDIASVEPAVVSAAGGTTRAGKNEVFTITVVTSKSIDKVKLANESGASIGILTKSFVVEGNTKVWTLTAKIGTAGERTVTAFGAPKDEDYLTQGQSFGITITK